MTIVRKIVFSSAFRHLRTLHVKKGSIMQGFADIFILVIPVEDDPLHTNEHPFCLDPTCPCKEDQELLGQVAQQIQDGLFTPAEASYLVAGKTL